MMTPEQSAAFISAQTQMMILERQIMLSENHQSFKNGQRAKYTVDDWNAFKARWEMVLGYNAILLLFGAP